MSRSGKIPQKESALASIVHLQSSADRFPPPMQEFRQQSAMTHHDLQECFRSRRVTQNCEERTRLRSHPEKPSPAGNKPPRMGRNPAVRDLIGCTDSLPSSSHDRRRGVGAHPRRPLHCEEPQRRVSLPATLAATAKGHLPPREDPES